MTFGLISVPSVNIAFVGEGNSTYFNKIHLFRPFTCGEIDCVLFPSNHSSELSEGLRCLNMCLYFIPMTLRQLICPNRISYISFFFFFGCYLASCKVMFWRKQSPKSWVTLGRRNANLPKPSSFRLGWKTTTLKKTSGSAGLWSCLIFLVPRWRSACLVMPNMLKR